MIAGADCLGFLAQQLSDPEAAWSLGTFGAIAEFTRDADEAADFLRTANAISVVTPRGALRLEPPNGLRPIASESPTTENWNHRVALCLARNACPMNGRKVLTELGPDREALRDNDRQDVLFDLGLGALQVDICIRSGDPAIIGKLRECEGKSVFASDSGAMGVILAANPHRVFISRVGRIEVFQPIPPANGKSPSGPHTHVLPKLLAHGRTHAATEPLPDGWVPCAYLYPPNPVRDLFGRSQPFQRERHAAFQSLLAQYGDPQLIEIKRQVTDAVKAGQGPADIAVAEDRFARAAVRIALRQLRASNDAANGKDTTLAAWLSVHDRLEPVDAEDSTQIHR